MPVPPPTAARPSTPTARRVGRRRRRCATLVAGLAALGLVLVGLAGCAATVTPPPGPFDDPVEVAVLHEALHTGLVLPASGGGYVEHGFGDWSWFAEEDTASYRVFPVVLWPTRAAWSRRVGAAPALENLQRRWPHVRLTAFTVERATALRLRDRLEDAWHTLPGPRLLRGADRHAFVSAEPGYWFGYNCNDAVAEWLDELGCDTGWSVIRTGLHVEGRALRQPD